MTKWRTTLPLRAGDIFFCRGTGTLDAAIRFFQALRSKDGDTRTTHTGIILDPAGTTFETTPWLTGNQNLGQDYAGSDIAVFRWKGMTDVEAAKGYAAVRSQRGRVYPYWRLAAQAIRMAGALHGTNMECCVLAAHFLRAAGCPLEMENLWSYDTETLYDELRDRLDFQLIFDGDQRKAGRIVMDIRAMERAEGGEKAELPPISDHHNSRVAKFERDVEAPCAGGVMFIGDSITESWELPEHAAFLPRPVINRGIAGDTTKDICEILPLLYAESPRAVFISLGTNNLGWGTPAAVNRILPDLSNIIGAFRFNPNTRIYLQSLFPVNAPILESVVPGATGERSRENIEKINSGLAQLAEKLSNTTFINLYPHFLDESGALAPALTTDGLHLSAEGYRLWASLLYPFLGQASL